MLVGSYIKDVEQVEKGKKRERDRYVARKMLLGTAEIDLLADR